MQPRTLLEALELAYADKLRAIYDVLGGDKASRPARKDQLVRAINRILLSRVRDEWNGLRKDEKRVIQEAVHDTFGQLDVDKFIAKYGTLPNRKRFDARYGQSRTATRLDLFLHKGERHDPPSWIPCDLQQLLRDFVPEPPRPALSSLAEFPATVELKSPRYLYDAKSGKYIKEVTTTPAQIVSRDTEAAAKAGALTVLSLIDQGKVSVSTATKRPSAASTKRIGGVLDDGDFYELTGADADVGPIQAFAWPLLVQAGRLAKQDGSRLELTAAGRKALSSPPHETIKLLWSRWLKSKIIDELSRVEAIKGQTRGRGKRGVRAVEPRRWAIGEALAQCPPRGVVSIDDFARFMVAADLNFEVTRSPWALYMGDAHYGRQYGESERSWSIFQDRYLLCFLFEYVATLGMIDVAFVHPSGARKELWELTGQFEGTFLSRYDGLKFFRLTALGAYCLGLADTYEPETPRISTPISVFPDRRIVVQNGSLDGEERAFLRRCADGDETGLVWRLSTEKILKAIETGLDVGTVREFLSARDEQPLPELVEGFLSRIESRVRAIRPKGTGVVFECDSAETVETLLSDRRIAKYSLRAGERTIVVNTSSENAFRKTARMMGFGFDNR